MADQAAKVAEVRAAYPEAEVDELDGLTLRFPDGAWFNLRASNTEPLLRLNVEAPDAGADGRPPRRGARPGSPIRSPAPVGTADR